jgi:GntR family transcriptional regulator
VRIHVDYNSNEPICQQVAAQVKLLCVSGELEAGQKLPSIRQFARDLHVNPTTVTRIYDQLAHEGVVILHQGRGTFVAESPPPLSDQEVQRLVGKQARALLVEGLRHGLSFQDIQRALQREHENITRDSNDAGSD